MNKKLKIFLLLLFGIVVILFSLRFYLRNIYYPNNPVIYSSYRTNPDFDPDKDYGIQPMDPPVGGCWNNCWGEEVEVTCEQYSPKYDRCEFECYGPHYNNCSSGTLGTLMDLIFRQISK